MCMGGFSCRGFVARACMHASLSRPSLPLYTQSSYTRTQNISILEQSTNMIKEGLNHGERENYAVDGSFSWVCVCCVVCVCLSLFRLPYLGGVMTYVRLVLMFCF